MSDYTEAESSLQEVVDLGQADVCANRPAGDEDTGAQTGLESYINKVIVIFDTRTGRYILVDNEQSRIDRMRKKMTCWSSVCSHNYDRLGCTFVKVGLTYRNDGMWKAGHVTEFIQGAIKAVGKDNVYAYAWVAELTEVRHRVHYHALFYVNPKVKIPTPDKSGLWVHRSSSIKRGIDSSWYLNGSYLRKLAQKKGDFPSGLRMFATWLNKDFFSKADYWNWRKGSYPRWLVQEVESQGMAGSALTRRVGGGWTASNREKLGEVPDTAVFQSPFRVYADKPHIEMLIASGEVVM